jgi:hypothetical protein
MSKEDKMVDRISAVHPVTDEAKSQFEAFYSRMPIEERAVARSMLRDLDIPEDESHIRAYLCGAVRSHVE